MSDRLDALARPDKWYLAAGEGVIWAPAFPEHLDRPGFWDEAHVFHFPVRPLFTVALVDARGRALALVQSGRWWRPDRLTVRWQVGDGVILVEERAVLAGARFGSVWTVESDDGWRHPAVRDGWLVAFTQQPERDTSLVGGCDGGISWRRRIVHREHLETDLGFDLLAAGGAAIRSVVRSEGRATPDWSLTPFPERWLAADGAAAGGLCDDLAPRGIAGRGWLHVALAVPLSGASADAVSFTLRVRTPGYLAGEPDVRDEVVAHAAPRPASRGEGTSGWLSAFDAFPRFRCSDPHLERYWDYRIYGLHLNRLSPGSAGYPHPAIAEGIEYFHWPISYSAQCHMLEMRWSRDPAVARGALLNFLEAQREDGSLPGRLHLCPGAPPEPDFYHANWGDAVLAVDALHPDDAFLACAFDGLARYARWLMSARDPSSTGMVTVTNHYETGQEYMSRYVAVDAAADTSEWEPRLALKGIDVTVYVHRLQRALARIADRLGRPGEARVWAGAAAASGAAIMDAMWDADARLFSDVDGATMRRTGVKAAVCFYPLLTDLLDDAHVGALLEHLTNPEEFGTPWPVPSSSVDDPLFDAEGLWKGKRHNCPWNGRVWPMTNSHVADGLLRQWRSGRRAAGPVAAALLARFVHMMFDDQDVSRPNCFEHYNPFTAHPSRFRGIDDYQHSWVLDLLVRGAAGLDVDHWLGGATDGSFLTVDPLPMGLATVDLEGVPVRGHRVDVRMRGAALTVTVDGREHAGTLGTPLRIALADAGS